MLTANTPTTSSDPIATDAMTATEIFENINLSDIVQLSKSAEKIKLLLFFDVVVFLT